MKATTKTLSVISLYNLGFMGGNREGVLKIDGQYKVLTDFNEFVLIKIGDYGNFTSFPEIENSKPEILADNEYRFVHDAILKALRRKGDCESSDFETFSQGQKYKLHKNRISANIDYGDRVIELDKNREFVVDGGHDVSCINRNYNYKLVDRELHPEPATLEEIIAKIESLNPFEKWTKLDAMPKKNKNWMVERFIINGETFNTIKDYSGNNVTYIIQTPKGEVYQMRSNISAPFHDTMDILSGKVDAEYDSIEGKRYEIVFKDVVHESDRTEWFYPNRYKKATLKSSYDYNTRLTYL